MAHTRMRQNWAIRRLEVTSTPLKGFEFGNSTKVHRQTADYISDPVMTLKKLEAKQKNNLNSCL
jgi:hypothetical protein